MVTPGRWCWGRRRQQDERRAGGGDSSRRRGRSRPPIRSAGLHRRGPARFAEYGCARFSQYAFNSCSYRCYRASAPLSGNSGVPPLVSIPETVAFIGVLSSLVLLHSAPAARTSVHGTLEPAITSWLKVLTLAATELRRPDIPLNKSFSEAFRIRPARFKTCFEWCPRQDLNLCSWLRRPVLYPG